MTKFQSRMRPQSGRQHGNRRAGDRCETRGFATRPSSYGLRRPAGKALRMSNGLRKLTTTSGIVPIIRTWNRLSCFRRNKIRSRADRAEGTSDGRRSRRESMSEGTAIGIEESQRTRWPAESRLPINGRPTLTFSCLVRELGTAEGRAVNSPLLPAIPVRLCAPVQYCIQVKATARTGKIRGSIC